MCCSLQLRDGLARDWPSCQRRRAPPRPRPETPRHAAPVRRQTADRVVSRGHRRRARDSQAGNVPWPRSRQRDVLVHRGRSRIAPTRHRAASRILAGGPVMTFQALLQGFFVDRLVRQRRASPHTIAAYRDTFRLLLRFATARLHKPPSRLAIEDLDASFVSQFLEHLERERGNGARTRNARLAAIHGFFNYVALTEPAHALLCQRVLAIPSKRFERGPVEFLAPEEIEALLSAPNAATWIGRRDRTFLLVAVQTGLRVSELISLRRGDVVLGNGAHVRCQGKGRKTRCTPLRRDVARVLDAWLREQSVVDPQRPVFPSARGGPLSRDAIDRLVGKHVTTALKSCASLSAKNITTHTLRR